MIMLILSVGFHNLLIQVYFKINQLRIAKTLCIEKDIKDSKCGGCCQLKKSLAEQNTEEGNLPLNNKQNEVVYFLQAYNIEKLTEPAIENEVCLWPAQESAILLGYLSSLLDPPDFIS